MGIISKKDKNSEGNSLRDFKEQLILKEMEIAHSTVKNLDDIIYKTKNFAFLAWGGGLALLIKYLTEQKDGVERMHWLILLTGLIPLLFWAMDYWWRKHLRMISSRERKLSLFINSEDIEKHLKGEVVDNKFPLMDYIGWIYTEQARKKENKTKPIPPDIGDKYLVDMKEYSKIEILFYKDAWVYYLGMTAISILFWWIGFKPHCGC